VNAWIGYYFYIHMSLMSYIFSVFFAPFVAVGLYFGINSVYFPFYNTPIIVMLLLTAFVPILSKRKAERLASRFT